ncbi:MAG: DinB family protein [Bacteroidota bacterium]|nr:DinB family protein [Bacteroidota bacterium]
MIQSFKEIGDELTTLISEWEIKLENLPEQTVTYRFNSQNRSIRQILGHMVDSATNNTHRVIHMHYQSSPVKYPDYANLGNNDRWIAIQNYQEEDWGELVRLWAAVNRHMVHLIGQVNESKLNQLWTSALNKKITLREMISDYPRHFKLHLNEISALINQLTIEHD